MVFFLYSQYSVCFFRLAVDSFLWPAIFSTKRLSGLDLRTENSKKSPETFRSRGFVISHCRERVVYTPPPAPRPRGTKKKNQK